eukprot:COSAG01_NODE_28550_length_658_cov_1.599284_1_plen_41_part_10
MPTLERPSSVKWKKRFQGDWTEPGMGGKFTPLSIAPEGYMH